jgi:hypothetical protein
MGMIKNYLNDIICACSEEQFGQDAVEYAVQMGLVELTGNKDDDVRIIMSQYDDICQAYRKEITSNEAALVESYGPLLEEIAEERWRDRQLFPDEQSEAA